MNNVLAKVINLFIIISVLYTQTYANVNCNLLETGCSLYKYNTTETKRICIEKKEVWDCATSKTVQVGCDKYERDQNCSGFITLPKDIYETKDYRQAFGQAIVKLGAFDQINDIWSGWKGKCDNGWFTDFSWLKDPLFLLGAATTLAAGGAFGAGIKNSYTAATTAAKSAMSKTVGWLSGGLLGSTSFAACMAASGLSPTNLITYAVKGKASGSNSPILSQKHPTLYITNSQAFTFTQISKFNGSQIIGTKTDAIGGKFVTFKSQADAINTKSMQCDGSLGAVSGGVNVATGLASGSVAGYLKAANSAALLAGSSAKMAGTALAKYAHFMAANPILMFAISIAIQVILSFSKCNACTSIKCAMKVDKSGLQAKTNQFLNRSMCHYINTNCSWKVFLFGCLRHESHYCCYDQILTRIFVEQAKLQLNKNWNSCNDISFDDLNKLSFRQCGPHENQYKDKCMDFTEFTTVLQRQLNKKLNNNDLGKAAASALGGSIISPN